MKVKEISNLKSIAKPSIVGGIAIIILAFYFLGALMVIPAEETVLSPILSSFKWVAVVIILLGASDLLLGCTVWYYANKLERRLERIKGR